VNESEAPEKPQGTSSSLDAASPSATIAELSANIRAVIASAQHSIDVALEHRASLIAQFDALYRTPLTSQDALALILKHIDAMAERYVREGGWANCISALAYPVRPPGSPLGDPDSSSRRQPLCLSDYVAALSPNPTKRFEAFSSEFLNLSVGYSDQDGSPTSMSGLCFWFGDVLKQKLQQHWDRIWRGYRPHDEARIVATAEEMISKCEELMAMISELDQEIAIMQGEIATAQSAVRANLQGT